MRPSLPPPLLPCVLSSLCLALAFAGCAPHDPAPAMASGADSLAMDIIDANGGWEAWAALPLLRFDWAFVRDSAEIRPIRHLWDRENQRARVEWSIGEDSTAVVILDLAASTPEAPSGEAFVNGAVSPPEDSLLARGYSRWTNDTYWLLAPMKTFDPGVNRALAPDSAGPGERVLALSFGDVGLTPGDRYWLHVGDDGAMRSWTYLLEGDTTVTSWTWASPEAVQGPAGPVTFYTRKTSSGGATILTTPTDTSLPDSVWTAPTPLLR